MERTATIKRYYFNSSYEILTRKRDDDFLLLSQGTYQRPIANDVKLFLTCEPGIGYRGSWTKYRAFESAYLMNFTYGSQHPGECINGNYFHRVIPNYFDEKDFPFCDKKEDYYLFIGRMIPRKGIATACQAVEHIGGRLLLAGQGDYDLSQYKCAEKVGYLEPDKRAELMGKARAVFVPTIYLEAFGGVNVEAQLCGTPAICTNFGAFPETVIHGVTGYLCNTLQDFVEAANDSIMIDPYACRNHAERYLMQNVKWEFERWFTDLYALYESAHDDAKKAWHRLE